VTLHAAALGDHAGRVTLTMPLVDGAPQEQWASTAKDYRAHVSDRVAVARFDVPLVTLDSLGLDDVTAMKVDAEGAEYEILRGARETLLRCRSAPFTCREISALSTSPA
jgi:FkbM family methyltransferase